MSEEFLQWLEEQDSYYVKQEEIRRNFPDLDVRLIGITATIDDDGNTLIPKRDYRQAIKYGQVYD